MDIVAMRVRCIVLLERKRILSLIEVDLITYVEPFQTDVTDKEFIRIRASDVIAEQDKNYSRSKHAVAIAIKVKPFTDLLTCMQQKTVTFALSAQDTMVHFRPFTHLSRFWVTQLASFFDIFVNGKSNPDIIVKPNIHLSNIVIDYDHKLVVAGSPMSLKINIGACDLFKLDPPRLYFQDTTLSIRKNDNRNADFVKLLGVEMLVLEVNTATEEVKTKQKSVSAKKSTEIVIQDATVKAWMCSDTISEFMNLINGFLSSEYGSAFKNGEPVATVQKKSRPVPKSMPTVDDTSKSKSVDLCDVVQVNFDAEDGEPTEFVETFDPKVKYIDDIQIVPNFIQTTRPEKNLDAEIPDDHPLPTFKLLIKNASLNACLYGGNDFGTDYNPKVFSKFNDAADLKACRRDGVIGGPHRDHTVWIEMKATKIDFEHSSFDTTGNISSLQVLKIGNVECYDHLIISDAEKLLKKHDSQRYIYPKPALLLRHAINQNNEGKLHLRLEPLKLNIDQDTMEFLTDFIGNVGSGLTETAESDENFDEIPSTSAARCETLYTEFKFFPSCKINFDYTGKRIDLQHQQGMVSGLASGILQLTGTELILKELDNTEGLYGFSKCIAYAIEQWSADVITQLPSNLVTLAPVAPISNVVSSVIYHSSSVVYPSVRMLLAPWRYYQQTDQD
uniref:Autophagy-related protein 2 n=1 Tax=Panagrellus redivivus TaxID=6233 RepID=A0A7E4VTY4_PANRE